jgi:molybdate transport system substrate-binding protein
MPLTAELQVMSGAAVEPGLLAAADAFRRQTGNRLGIVFATTPQMRQRFAAGETPDVIIAPPALLDELERSGRIDGSLRVPLGRVGVGVAIRADAPIPDVSTADALKRVLLEADRIIYNRASSGLYVERLLQRLGIAERIEAKTERYTGTDMAAPLIEGRGKDIGFMPVAQILHLRSRGMQLAGPLPAEIQHYTEYVAAATARSEPAHDFVCFLGAPEARALFAAAGIR